uniref:Uncharacterized protein n=1 Tax=Amphimedon queenslandica TaxID=400682 RepID=A0A1X7UJV2_AMPQE
MLRGSVNKGLLPQAYICKDKLSPKHLKGKYLNKSCADSNILNAVKLVINGTDDEHHNISSATVIISSRKTDSD